MLLAALLPGTPASARACRGAGKAVTPATVARARAATLCLVNRARRGAGLGRVRRNADLRAAAQRHSADMVARSYFAHDTPDGVTPLQRIIQAGYLLHALSWEVGETLGTGGGRAMAPAAIVRAWLNSPEHRAILLDGRYRDVGIGIAPAGHGAVYTADFGRR